MYTPVQIFEGFRQGVFSARDVLFTSGLGNTRAAAVYFGVDIRTVQRWLKTDRLPESILLGCQYRAGVLSGMADSQWRDWYIVGHDLICPSGWRFSQHDILRIFVYLERIRQLESEVEKLTGTPVDADALPDNVCLFIPPKS